MATIQWNNGQLITLNVNDTASCVGTLAPGQIYCLFFYNSAQNDKDANIGVVWSQSKPPVSVKVPGTTANQGLAALCFVSGSDTNTVSVSLNQAAAGAQVQAFIGSVQMPMGNDGGMQNIQLQTNGQPQAFTRFTRYYAVLESHWYNGTLQSNVNQFISVQFSENAAVVNVVNQLVNPGLLISYCGSAASNVTTNTSQTQQISWYAQGNGGQTVWINADSIQNSEKATITMQSMSNAYAVFDKVPQLEGASG